MTGTRWYCIDKTFLVILTLAVITTLVFIQTNAAYADPTTPENIKIHWEQRTVKNGQQVGNSTSLSPDALINEDPDSQVRVHIDDIPDNCPVTKVEIIVYGYGYNSHYDDWTPVPVPHQPQANTDPWMSVPHSTAGFFRDFEYFFPHVTMKCTLANGQTKEVTKDGPYIDIPITKTSEETIETEETTDSDKTNVGANGQVKGSYGVGENGGSGAVQGETSAGSSSSQGVKHVKVTKTIDKRAFDPTANMSLVTYSVIPKGWIFDLDNKTITLGPNETGSIYLQYLAPTKDYVVFAVKSSGLNYSFTSRPMIFIANDPPILPIQSQRVYVGNISSTVWYNVTNGNVNAIQAFPNNNTLSIRIQPQGEGTLELILLRDVINSSSPLQVLLDNSNANNTQIISNDLFREIVIPFHANSSNISIVGTHVIPEFGPLSAIVITALIVGVVIISRVFNFQSRLKT